MAEQEEIQVVDNSYSSEFYKQRSVSNKPIQNIGWFNNENTDQWKKSYLQVLLNKVPKEQVYKSATDKRPDQIFRKTKIISTLGKHSSTDEAICKLIEQGTNIFRINMSTIQNKEHKDWIERIKKAQKLMKTKCGILIDLQGPVIRTGEFMNKSTVQLKAGQEFRICCKKKILGDESFVCVDFQELENKIKIGDHIIVDFGSVCMRVIGFEEESDFLMSKQLENGIEVKHSLRQIRQGKNSMSQRPGNGGLKNLAGNLESKKNTIPLNESITLHPKVEVMPLPQKIVEEEETKQERKHSQHHILSNVCDEVINESSTELLTDEQIDQLKQELNQTLQKQENDQELQKQQLIEQQPSSVQMPTLQESSELLSSRFFEKSDSFRQREYEEEIAKKKKKFPLSFDETYSKTNEGKFQLEKEFFENPQNHKRFQNTTVKNEAEYVQTTMVQKQVSNSLMRNQDSIRNRGGLPSLSVIQESNGETDNIKRDSTLQSEDSSQADDSMKTPQLNPFRQVSSANNMLASHDDLKPRGNHNAPNRRRKKLVKERKVIVCRVEFDCELKPHKPLYFPEFDYKQEFDLSVVTTKDIRDIHSIIKLGVDFISVSYVESKNDILEVRDLLSIKGRHIKVIAKIQNRKALQNFEEILDVSDGIIIARGYLGLDLKLEDVAYVQNYLIKKCNLAGKPVILSTQIMESMVRRLRPTRAEVSDISNAVFDGIDCCILSSETHTGPFYEKSCEIMSKICYEAEQHIDYEGNYDELQTMIMQANLQLSMAETICNCAVKAAYEMDAKLIIVFTNSGTSAILVSKYRPKCPILAVSASDKSAKQIMISRGIFYLLVGSLIGAESLLDKVKLEALAKGLVKKGDFVIVTTGVNEGLEGSTNLLKILQI